MRSPAPHEAVPNPADDLNEATLRKERTESSLPVAEVTKFLFGGEENVRAHQKAASIVASDPVFSRRSAYFLSRPDAYANALRKCQRLKEIIHEHGLDEQTANLVRLYVGEQLPVNLHFVMFLPTLRGQATEEQQRRWLPDAEAMRIVGTYAQTELGHGSFVRGLETTATYDPTAEEFVLLSPTLTAGKWWPGGLGRTSTHAVVMARLVTLGKDHGVHAFMVQLRSLDTHLPLPGVELLDIGPKCGYATIDNGHLRLNSVRIPRENMLMRFATVTPDGVYRKPPHAKLAYGTMVYVRAHMVLDAARSLGAAVAIATRYSAVRRQFLPPSGAGAGAAAREVAVLDYPAQQHKLVPLIAASYAFFVAGNDMRRLYDSLQRDLSAGDFSSLPDVHALCSGLKVTCSDIASAGIELSRRACGGHGYSMFAGINDLLQDYKAAVSYEGENTVLVQQTARYLIKASATAAARGAGGADALAPGARYLARDGSRLPHGAEDAAAWLRPELGVAALEARARAAVRAAAEALAARTGGGMSPDAAWTAEQVALVRAGEAHAELCLARTFAEGVLAAPAAFAPVLSFLSAVFNLSLLDRHPAATAAAGLASAPVAAAREGAMALLTARLRPEMVPLVDAFGFTDHFLNSALGRYDGRVYEAMLAWAREGTLNRSEVAPGVVDHLQPMMRAPGRLRAKL